MKKIIYSLLFFFFSFTYNYAQHTSIKVNGLELGQAYTDSKIRDSLGNPTSVLTGSDDDTPGVITYLYNNNWFTFQNGVLILFVIKTSQFKLNNFLNVGMNLNVTSQMGGVFTPFNSGAYCWYPNENYRSQVGCVTIQYNTLENAIVSIVGESPGFIL